MPCFSPMVASWYGAYTENGKHKMILTRRYDGVNGLMPKYQEKVVPCGQCIGCRLDYSRQWANRMMCELEYHQNAYFVTLTYNDGHLPISYYPDPGTGEAFESMTLKPDDLKAFMKRLRRQQEYNGNDKHIAFFACGEYGGKNLRPHYHLILYDIDLPDLKPVGKSNAGEYKYFSSEILEKLWSAPAARPYLQIDRGNSQRLIKAGEKSSIGNVQVCNVSWETCAYVARYIVKKQKGQASVYYDTFSLVPEFTRMSLKPAIGKQYFDDHKGEIYRYDRLYLSTAKRGISSRPPAYFDRLFDAEQPSMMENLKQERVRKAQLQLKAQLDKFSGNYFDFLAAQEKKLHNKAKKLERSIE